MKVYEIMEAETLHSNEAAEIAALLEDDELTACMCLCGFKAGGGGGSSPSQG